MDELVRWLGEQLDEDERIARATTERQPYDEWDAMGAGDDDDAARSHWEVVKIARMGPTPAARSLALHIAAHDPARVLREIDAKRRMIEAYERTSHGERTAPHDDMRDVARAKVDSWRFALRLLALSYVDRPGFREEWRP